MVTKNYGICTINELLVEEGESCTVLVSIVLQIAVVHLITQHTVTYFIGMQLCPSIAVHFESNK